MAKNELTKKEKQFFILLGERIKARILDDLGYQSLDRFALENHELITKPTLYAICDGSRDFQFSTIFRISKAIDVPILDLLKDIDY